MWKPMLCLAVCLIVGHAAAQEMPADIRFCESAFEASGEWRHPNRDTLTAALTDASEKKAVTEFFGSQLDAYPAEAMTREAIVDALKGLLRHDGADLTSEKPLDFCVVLENCRIDPADRERFKPVEIGRICGINPNLVQTQIRQIGNAFVKRLTEDEASEKRIASVMTMMADPDRIAGGDPDSLKSFVHEVGVDPPTEALDGTVCLSLIVYPVELFALSLAERHP